MSQNDFAKLFNVARPSIGAYEEGRAEPKIETVIQIAKHFGISIDALLTKEITVNELLKFRILEKGEIEAKKQSNKDDLLHTTPFVSVDQQSEYVVQFSNRDFINSLPILQVPFTQAQKSRAFQVYGSEMAFGSGGIRNDDVLVCDFFDHKKGEWITDQMYVLIHQQGITQKRFTKTENGELHFVSDNPSYGDLTLSKEQLLEVWLPVCLITNKFPQPKQVENRLSDLEEKIQMLLDKSSS